jgi:hypothetical protein
LGAKVNGVMVSSQLFLGLIPLSFGYAIIRFRLRDVEAIVRRSAAYVVTSSLLLGLYLVLALVLGKWLESLVPNADFALICIAVLAVAMLFAPLRNSIQSRLDRFFYREHFEDRESLLDFARALSSEISLPRLTRSILDRISRTFDVHTVALFLRDAGTPSMYRLADSVGYTGADRAGGRILADRQLRSLPRHPGPNPGETLLYAADPELVSEGFHYLQEIRSRGARIGVMALGQPRKNRHFSSEDLDLLAALAGYAGIAVENAALYQSIESKALELERLKIYTENILESINIAVLALDSNGRINSCNRAFENLYGAGRMEITGFRAEELLGGDVAAAILRSAGAATWDIRTTGSIFKQYLRNRRSENLIVNLSVIPMAGTQGFGSGCLIVMDDITEKVRLEDQLLQAEKLSSIGLLAAGIAHEVNTPITGISSYAQMLLKETPAGDARKPILEKIEKQTFRAAEIVNGLLNFARMNGSEFTDLDVNQLIRETLLLLDHQFRQNRVEVSYAPDASIPPVYGNAGKLQQVFVNLFLNAKDAMPSGGTLKVATAKNDTMVVIDIRDSGVGISAEDIRRIYDPFFTTKKTGKGTGLGLAVTYGIIQEHGGRISVDSLPSQGTSFRLKLPTRQSMHE